MTERICGRTAPARFAYSCALRDFVAVLFSGTMLFLAWPPRPSIWCGAVALVPLLTRARGRGIAAAFVLGFSTSAVAQSFAFAWLPRALCEVRLSPTTALVATAVLIGWQAGALGITIAVTTRWTLGLPTTLVLPVVVVATEFAYPVVLPIPLHAAAIQTIPAIQIADIVGALGVSALLAAVNGLFVDAIASFQAGRSLPLCSAAAVALSWTLTLAYGFSRIHAIDDLSAGASHLRVGIVQVNPTAAERAADPESVAHADLLERYRAATHSLAAYRPDLVIWGEAAVGRQIIDPATLNVQRALLEGSNLPLLFGGRRGGADPHGNVVPYNSAFLSDSTGAIRDFHDKVLRVPVGEYVPFTEIAPVLRRMLPVRAMGRGQTLSPLRFGETQLAVTICYEGTSPSLIRQMVSAGHDVGLIVNLANDWWASASAEPEQHLAMVVLRAVEQRKALVRVATNGVSAFIDAAGRISKRTSNSRGEAMVDSVPILTTATFYQRHGDVLGMTALVLLAIGFLTKIRARKTTFIALLLMVSGVARSEQPAETGTLNIPAGSKKPFPVHIGDRVEFHLVGDGKRVLRSLMVTFTCVHVSNCKSSREDDNGLRPATILARIDDDQPIHCQRETLTPQRQLSPLTANVFGGIKPKLAFQRNGDPNDSDEIVLDHDSLNIVASQVGALAGVGFVYESDDLNPSKQSPNKTQDDIDAAQKAWPQACKDVGADPVAGTPPQIRVLPTPPPTASLQLNVYRSTGK